MKIETKFNIGDKVYVLFNGSIKSPTVKNIKIDCTNKFLNIYYSLGICLKLFPENRLFTTKEDLIKNL